jgi:hypothetical protein
MTFIQLHITNTNLPMFSDDQGCWKTNVAEIGRNGMVQGYDKNARLLNSSDFSSFDSYNKIHLHYERL